MTDIGGLAEFGRVPTGPAPEPQGDPVPLPPPGAAAPPPAVTAYPPPPGYGMPGAPQPPRPDDSGVPIWALVAMFVLVLALGAATVYFVLPRGGSDARTYPSSWDPRIAPYVKIAEKQRGLKFQHPVQVYFLPAKEFEKTVTTDDAELTDEDRAEVERMTGEMRALGLLTGDVDLTAAMNDAQSGGVLAYYSLEDETITVRGTKVRPEVRSTLVHELTHVLQDQNFSLGAKYARLQEDEAASDSTALSVLRAIAEGDAERIEAKYRDSLSAKQRKALDRGQDQQGKTADKRLDDVPTVLVTMMSSPYLLGSALVGAAAAEGGNDAVDALLRDPPQHDIALLQPFAALKGARGVADVETPPTAKDDTVHDTGELGALTWYLMLSERMPATRALSVVDGWHGDSYVSYADADGTSCVKAAYAGRTAGDSKAMLRALRGWVGAAPGSPAKVRHEGDLVVLRSCDPGSDAKVGSDSSGKALELAVTRSALGVGLVRSGARPAVAACVADRLVRIYPTTSLLDPTFGADDPAVQARVRTVAEGCR